MDLHFDPLQYRYPSRRRLVYGRRGMVCASQPLAAQAGLDMIKKGMDANEAIAKAKGTYGRFADAVKYIDPRKE